MLNRKPHTHQRTTHKRKVSTKIQHPKKKKQRFPGSDSHPITCSLCPALCKSRRKIVWGETYGADNPQVLVVAEAPGPEEDRTGSPLVGISGQEARHHLTINGIAARGVYLDNIVKCHPPGNRDPSPDEIRSCTTEHLIPLVLTLQPKWIITMGRISTRFFLGDVDMEMTHGIPRPINFLGLDVVVVPTYHPAAGLHSPEKMLLFNTDMASAGAVIRGTIPPNPPEDEWAGREQYTLLTDDMPFPLVPEEDQIVAVDTEWARKNPWCLSFSIAPGTAWVVMGDQKATLDALDCVLGYGNTITAVHNALYDLPVLEQMGIQPAKPADTMVMAYLLQTEPQGLKPLAFRHCGMEMASYKDMVGEATDRLALEYLYELMELEWDDPDPVLEWKKGEPRVRQPQNIKRKVARILKADGDWAKKWKAMKEKGNTEEVMGPMQDGELCDIDLDKAVYYSARDADATIRIFPLLWKRIKALGLDGTFWRDMRALPMVVDMMKNGMPVDLQAFANLGSYFQERMDLIQRKMQIRVGHMLGGKAINPGSYPQMSTLIYDKLRLQDRGGKYKSKKGAVKKSTANDILKRYVGLDPIVQDIIDWREYQKLKTSYADAIPRMVSPDGRIRTTLRITRVATGRLSSSKPNLMAQPVRSSEGRKVRDCYVAGPGKVLLSGDYSQVEMRVAANDSQDETMMGIFWRGEDIHAATASSMFGVPIPQLDPMKHRYPAKRVGFGILNLITAGGLQRELEVGGAHGWSLSDCEEMIKSWFNIYKGVAAYMKRNGEFAKRHGFVKDMWGRLRYIPGIRSTNRWVRMEAERQAGNAPIQMGAQGVIKEAMGRLVKVYRGMESIDPLIQIHDDIVWEIQGKQIRNVVSKIKPIMESLPPNFIIPLEVDFKTGKKWGSMTRFVQ